MLEAEVMGSVGDCNLSISIPAARSLLIVGPNGSGKSTFLMMLLGLRQPTAGRISLCGRRLFDSVRRINVQPERRRIGFLPQAYALFPCMNVLENVMFGLECQPLGLRPRERRMRALQLLDELGVGHLAHRQPRQLSGGEAQRVALARALAPSPQALLLDEPLAALDLDARGQVRAFLRECLKAKDLPTIMVSHDPEDCTIFPAWVVALEAGKVVQQGPFEELEARPATAFVAALAAGRSSAASTLRA